MLKFYHLNVLENTFNTHSKGLEGHFMAVSPIFRRPIRPRLFSPKQFTSADIFNVSALSEIVTDSNLSVSACISFSGPFISLKISKKLLILIRAIHSRRGGGGGDRGGPRAEAEKYFGF